MADRNEKCQVGKKNRSCIENKILTDGARFLSIGWNRSRGFRQEKSHWFFSRLPKLEIYCYESNTSEKLEIVDERESCCFFSSFFLFNSCNNSISVHVNFDTFGERDQNDIALLMFN